MSYLASGIPSTWHFTEEHMTRLSSAGNMEIYCAAWRTSKIHFKPDSWWTYLTKMSDIATCYMLYHISAITQPFFSGCLQIVATLPHGMTSVIQREEWYLCTSVFAYNSYNNWTSLDSIVSGVVIDGHTQCGKLVFLKDPRLHWYNHAMCTITVMFSIRTLDCTDTCYMQQHTCLWWYSFTS